MSRCLLGEPCRYDGRSKACDSVLAFAKAEQLDVVAVCPEVAGGLPIPRPAAELREGRIVRRDGSDVSAAFLAGAVRECERVREAGCDVAILKSKSPSCGCGQIYDGSFTGTLTAGDGLFCAALRTLGVRVFSECELEGRSADEILCLLGLDPHSQSHSDALP